jgi:hypothetical protein
VTIDARVERPGNLPLRRTTTRAIHRSAYPMLEIDVGRFIRRFV